METSSNVFFRIYIGKLLNYSNSKNLKFFDIPVKFVYKQWITKIKFVNFDFCKSLLPKTNLHTQIMAD